MKRRGFFGTIAAVFAAPAAVKFIEPAAEIEWVPPSGLVLKHTGGKAYDGDLKVEDHGTDSVTMVYSQFDNNWYEICRVNRES